MYLHQDTRIKTAQRAVHGLLGLTPAYAVGSIRCNTTHFLSCVPIKLVVSYIWTFFPQLEIKYQLEYEHYGQGDTCHDI